MNRKVRAVIVDDEPLARVRIRQMLARDPEIEIVQECSNARAAVDTIRKDPPDLLFLDVQMPGMDGFSVLKQMDSDRVPAVIFVTAFDEFAVQAFDVHATDYLLKPISRKRFDEALRRAKEKIQSKQDWTQRLTSVLERLESKAEYLERLAIDLNGKVRFINVDQIDWVESEDNYVRIHAAKETYQMRFVLNRLESRLNPKQFLRIHRRFLVNIDRVRELIPWSRRSCSLVLQDGTRLPVSRRLKEHVSQALGKAH